MSKSLFISTVHEDSHRIDSIKRWANDNRLGDVTITHETEDKRHLGKEAIKQHIMNKVRGASTIIVLIGQDTHNHDWIAAEVELANSFHKKIVCMQVPNTTGSVPQLLNSYELINFDPDSLKRVLN